MFGGNMFKMYAFLSDAPHYIDFQHKSINVIWVESILCGKTKHDKFLTCNMDPTHLP